MKKGVKRTSLRLSDSTVDESAPIKKHAPAKGKRKKAKPCSATEVADKLDRSSTDESDKSACNLQESNATESDLHRPLLLSQSGKFIPKFSAKKRLGSCYVVKIEPCVHVASDTANCSASASEAAEVELESHATSATDELKHNSSHTVSTENTPSYNNDSQPANKHDEQFSSSNNGLIETTSSAKQGLMPVGTDLQTEEAIVRDHADGDDGSSSTTVEGKVNSGHNGNVSVEIGQCITSENSDYQDGVVETNPVSPSDSNQVGSGEVAVLRSAGDMRRAASHEDCMLQPQPLEVSDNETTCNEVMDRSKARTDGGGSNVVAVGLEAQVNTEDALNHRSLVSDEVVEADKDASLTLEHDKEPHPDVVADSNGSAEMATYASTETSDVSATVGELGVSGVSDDKSQTVVGPPVNRLPTEDADAPSGNSMQISEVIEAKQFISGSSEPQLFDDFLDLTDSQLCQMDDVSSESTVYPADSARPVAAQAYKASTDQQTVHKRIEGRKMINCLIAQLSSINSRMIRFRQEIASAKQRHLQPSNH